MAASPESKFKLEGTLQRRVLAAFMEGPFSGAGVMRKLGIRSPGTIYPVLHSLSRKGLIKQRPQQKGRIKTYALTDDGVQTLKTVLLGMSRPFFTYCIDSYAALFVNRLRELVEIDPDTRILSTLTYEPYKQWLSKYNATFLDVFEPPPATYHIILSGLLGTAITYGWKAVEFAHYFDQLIQSLEPQGTLIAIEIQRSDNVFVTMFFREVLGLDRVLGIESVELRDMLENRGLRVDNMVSERGLIIGVSTKPAR